MSVGGYKLGLVARCDNGGLGIESMEFAKNLQPDKVLCVMAGYQNYPERFPGCIKTDLNPTDGQVRDFLEGLDSVLTIETPYSRELFSMARYFNVRTVLKVNYEWLEEWMQPDLLVFPNRWHSPEGATVIPLPIDPTRFKFRERTQAKTFLHIVGHDAGYDRNGTAILAQAIPLVKSDVTFIIRSQVPHYRLKAWQGYRSQFADPRVVMADQESADNASLYDVGDVLVMPRRYGGQSLTMEEAALTGMPILTTFMEPQASMFIGGAACVSPGEMTRIRIKTEVEYANPDPAHLAQVIDYLCYLASDDYIKYLSRMVHHEVEVRAWKPWIDALRPR